MHRPPLRSLWQLAARTLLGALLLGSYATASVAAAQTPSMDDALTHFSRGEVDEARGAFEAILAAGDAVPATVARAHRHLGILHFAEGRDEQALRAFERSLSIEPDQPVPTEVSPEQQAVFRTVQRDREGQPMDFSVREVDGDIVAQLVQAPPDFVVRVTAESGARTWEGEGTQVRFAFDDGAILDERVPVTLVAHDASGNVVLQTRRSFARGATPAPTVAEGGQDLGWLVAVVIGVVVLGAAAVTVGVVATQRDGYMMPVVEWPGS